MTTRFLVEQSASTVRLVPLSPGSSGFTLAAAMRAAAKLAGWITESEVAP